jgi:hypothetical protein
MPGPILFVLVLVFGGLGAWLLIYPDRVMNLFATARERHRITNWLFFKTALRVRITGLMYLAAAVALVVYTSRP